VVWAFTTRWPEDIQELQCWTEYGYAEPAVAR
jgi:hypothetical protein